MLQLGVTLRPNSASRSSMYPHFAKLSPNESHSSYGIDITRQPIACVNTIYDTHHMVSDRKGPKSNDNHHINHFEPPDIMAGFQAISTITRYSMMTPQPAWLSIDRWPRQYLPMSRLKTRATRESSRRTSNWTTLRDDSHDSMVAGSQQELLGMALSQTHVTTKKEYLKTKSIVGCATCMDHRVLACTWFAYCANAETLITYQYSAV